jgi:hypothetical protein
LDIICAGRKIRWAARANIFVELFILLLAAWIGFIVYLFAEKYRLEKYRESIPLRIAVNGTRGKTGVVRMVASALRANGVKVCAKTSGSETHFIFPDGAEEEISRLGCPSIIEETGIIKRAAALGAEALVCEIMGIKSEYQNIESKKIINPGHTVIVNARIDHPEQGKSKEEILDNYLAAVPSGGRFYLPSPGVSDTDGTEVVLKLCGDLGLDEELCRKAFPDTKMDRGGFSVFKCGGMDCYNLFAVNDVHSTRALVDTLPAGPRIGLFNSRQDRPERSVQFVKAIRDGMFDDIKLFFVLGNAGSFFRRKIPGRAVSVGISGGPEKIMDKIKAIVSGDADFHNSTVELLGMGNIKGAEKLLDYWKTAEAHSAGFVGGCFNNAAAPAHTSR